MVLKTMLLGYTILLLLITLLTPLIIYLNLTIYRYKLPVENKDVFMIYNNSSEKIFLAKYITYRINYFEQSIYKIGVRLDNLINKHIVDEIGVDKLVIEIGFSNSTPLIIPKTLLTLEEYDNLINRRYGLNQIYSGLENTSSTYMKLVKTKYVIIIVKFNINSTLYIDFTKYIPPIIYYPKEVVLNTTFSELLKYSVEDTIYSSILKYVLNTLLNEYCVTDLYVEYSLVDSIIDYKLLFLIWMSLVIVNEYRMPGSIVKYFIKLFYKLRFLLNYMLRKLRALVQYILKLSRV
ncbi:MAG: hypothetical protein QW607_07070 [Desulfurococcaceae archaeon]